MQAFANLNHDDSKYYIFEDNNKLVTSFSSEIEKLLKNILLKKEEAWVVVCGGSTPIDLFVSLSNKTIDWGRVNITLTDERLVPINNEKSNEGMVADYLLQNKASKANLFGLNNIVNIKQHKSSNTCFLDSIDEIDLLILGMGSDGHTASFFSQDPNLPSILNLNNKDSISYVELPSSLVSRVTLNYSVLSKSKKTCLYITGEDKKITLSLALKSNNPLEYPIAIFLKKVIDIYWSP